MEIVSHSELAAYRSCPLKHYLAYHRRWVEPAKEDARSRGTLFHRVMEIHYKQIQMTQELMRGVGIAPRKGLLAWDYSQPMNLLLSGGDEYVTDGGPGSIATWLLDSIWRQIEPLLNNPIGQQTEEQATVEWIYRGYIQHWGLDPHWSVLAVEHAPIVRLYDDFGKPSKFSIKMKLDLIVYDLRNGENWIVDHKSSSRKPSDLALEIDDQFGLYTWGLRQLGKPVIGSIHGFSQAKQNKDPKTQPLEKRFVRTAISRSDAELDNVALDAWRNARDSRDVLVKAVRIQKKLAEAGTIKSLPALLPSSPNSLDCGWCDFSKAHVADRKGWSDAERYLSDTGWVREPGKRH